MKEIWQTYTSWNPSDFPKDCFIIKAPEAAIKIKTTRNSQNTHQRQRI
jgi:hypothetical protein